ncbi:MAG: cobalt transporter CbiM [Spirochaetes bacterium]|nr:cobalt transporter CbiM [Spirochaetota bacterium]
MHISDGVLSAEVLIAGAVLAAGGTAVGLKKMDMDQMPRVAVMTAAFFVASLIHLPIGPSSVHLLFLGLMGLLLGWSCFPAILVGLLLQSLLFQHGGLTVLGVNTINMALPAIIVYLVFGPLVRREGNWLPLAGAACAGAFAVLLSSLCTAFSLLFSGEEFTTMARLILIANLPIMGIEAVMSVFILSIMRRVKPEILGASLSDTFRGGEDVASK